jgi:hypothetical protein
MASQDMTDALKHPHIDVHFATIGDETITALETLSKIFTRKFTKPEANNVPPSPQKTASYTRKLPELHPVITSPINTLSSTKNTKKLNQTFENLQQPPRVVTTATARATPPRVQARPHHLSPRNLSRDFLDLGGANCAIAFVENHWTKTHMMNSVIHPSTGKEMQYKDIMKDPDLGPSFEIGLSNELGRICQGSRDIAGTNNAFFIDLKSIPKIAKLHMANCFVTSKPTKIKTTGPD